jgi:MtrB/PioB family decaheme-associated outer membrane protein
MKRRVGLVTKCMIGALLSSTAWSMPGMQARAADTMPVKAMEPTDAVPYWWFHGTVEAGGRFFLNNPQNAKQTANSTIGYGQQGNSLAGFYQYSDNRPGPFGNFDMAIGSRDGLYQFDALGTNVGYKDQSYSLDFSKAGQQYFSIGWDQSPHLYSTSALTPFTVNGNQVNIGRVGTTVSTLASLAQPTDIGIDRDTASASYRWTPTDNWDIKADYSHLSRTGTQVGSGFSNGMGGTQQFPKPVNDTTQNYSLNGEYSGTSPWGGKLTFKAGYVGSQYTDNYASYLVQNSGTPTIPAVGSNAFAEFATPPSNQANGGRTTLTADLPWKSHYAGTLNYTWMTQNDAFIPIDYGASAANYAAMPAQSLNGKIGTTLFNNTLTTKINPELTNKLSYRYYDYNNQTPEIFWSIANLTGSQFGVTKTPVNSLSVNYTKQNAGEELVWRPTKEWNLGALYGWEQYNWSRGDADITNEHTGKLFADWKPNSWLGMRSSVSFGARRYVNYNNADYTTYQWPGQYSGAYQYALSYRQLTMDNRNLWKANVAFDVVVLPKLTITPNFKYEDANYGLDPTQQQGLEDSNKWSAGIDATYVFSPGTSIMVGYLFERASQDLYGCSGEGSSNIGTNQCTPYTAAFPPTLTNDTATIHTFTAVGRYAAIPDKLDTELRYTLSQARDMYRLYIGGQDPTTANGGQFPDNTTWFQRLDATATYKFDKETVYKLGWKGDVKAKLRYTWERNSVANFSNDGLIPFTGTAVGGASGTLWMGWYNPNYNVHMMSASLVASW